MVWKYNVVLTRIISRHVAVIDLSTTSPWQSYHCIGPEQATIEWSGHTLLPVADKVKVVRL